MAADRTKILEAAQKYLAKGNYPKAIREYQKLLAKDPTDTRTMLKVGDAQIKAGESQGAAQTYEQVAEIYAKQGFAMKAVAVFKNILKIDNTRVDIHLRLGDMYRELDRVDDAVAIYENVANAYLQAGDADNALEVQGRIVNFDPENLPARIKYAEALSRSGRSEEASEEFRTGARMLKASGRLDDYAKVAERLLYHKPDDDAASRELARHYLQRGDAKRALSKLQLSFKNDPHDVGTLQLLARAFDLLGQQKKTVSVLRELARVFGERGMKQDRTKALRKILQIDPDNMNARQELAREMQVGSAGSLLAPPSSAVIGSGSSPIATIGAQVASDDAEIELLDSDLLLEDEDEEEVAQPREQLTMPPPSGDPELIDSETSREAKVSRLLAECDVFERYGLKEKVMDQLRSVLELDPNHIPTRERLKDLYSQAGRVEGVIEQLEALAVLFEGKPQVASLYRSEADRWRAANPERKSEDVFFVDDEASAPIDFAAAASVEPETHQPAPNTATASAPMQLSTESNYDGSTPFSTPKAASLEESRSSYERELFDEARAHAEAAARASTPPGEIEETLEEADFFLTQGLFEEAASTLEDALEAHPHHVLLQEKLAEIRAKRASTQSSPPAEVTEDSVLIRQGLIEAVGRVDDATVEGSDMIEVQTLQEASDSVAPNDADQSPAKHFELGMAYKELGLFDDAIQELQLAMPDPPLRCGALTLIGSCLVQKGEFDVAIARFKDALTAQHRTQQEEQTLYYELGLVYERMQNLQEALYYYEHLAKLDPTHRDVAERIPECQQALQRGTSSTPPPVDDIDVAAQFERLMRDTE